MRITSLILAFFFVTSAFGLPKALEVPESVRQKYSRLYQLPVESQPDGSKTFHEAHLFHRKGINVLSLKGDRFEMAFQHGRLLREEIKQGSVPQAAQMLEKAASTSLPNLPVVTEWLIQRLYEFVPDRMISKMQRDYPHIFSDLASDAWGLSEASGLTSAQVSYGMLGPESVMVLFGTLAENPLPFSTLPNSNACSAFAAWGDKTASKELIIGRNTDYALNGFYDKYPTAIYFNPTNGDQRYMTLGSAGIHISGVLGYNESGIYLGVHLIPTLDVSADSIPAFVLGQDVLRKAKSFEEAIQMMTKMRSGSGWTFMVASTKENRIASVEFSHNHVAVRESKGNFHVQTNHYLTPELSKQYYQVNNAVVTDTHSRLNRMQEVLEATPMLDIQKATRILADKTDSLHHKVRGVGNTVSVHTTMTSTVIDAAKGKIFMANGRAPVSQNDYVELPLPQDFNDSTFATDDIEIIGGKNYAVQFPEKANAEQKFIEAKIAFETDVNTLKAEKLMKQVVEIDNTNPHYFFTLAVFQMKNGMLDQASASLEKVTQLYDEHLKLVAHFYLGRIHASRMQKMDALKHFSEVLTHSTLQSEKKLYEATDEIAKKVKLFGFHVFSPQKIAFLMQEGDCVGYQ